MVAAGLLMAAGVAGAEEILEDDFSEPDASRELWQFVHGPSELADGVLVQRCAIAGQTARAVLAGTAGWEDYEVECRLKFLKCLPDRGGHAGIRLREINGKFLYAFDEECVYVGFQCYDSQMSQVRANVVERDGHAWRDLHRTGRAERRLERLLPPGH